MNCKDILPRYPSPDDLPQQALGLLLRRRQCRRGSPRLWPYPFQLHQLVRKIDATLVEVFFRVCLAIVVQPKKIDSLSVPLRKFFPDAPARTER